ncbi:actin interacting protein 3-domain-containing protein [Dipodascopsis uninucleata]
MNDSLQPPGSSSSSSSIASGRSISSGNRSLNRASAMSGLSGSQKRNTSKKQASMSTIESSVTKLLIATKQLLSTLGQWAHGETSEKEVSDVYVSLGNEFNITTRAFQRIGIDVSDLGDVPSDLRMILEEALSQEQSQAGLDLYLPSIREIIVNLLQGLKTKQQVLRSMMAASQETSQSASSSIKSQSSIPSGIVTPASPSISESSVVRRNNTTTGIQQSPSYQMPSRSSSMATSPVRRGQSMSSTTSGLTEPNFSDRYSGVLPPNNQELDFSSIANTRDVNLNPEISLLETAPSRHQILKDPLAALQKGDALERRASRRMSAYQYSKHGGSGSISVLAGGQIISPRRVSSGSVQMTSITEDSAMNSKSSDSSNRLRPSLVTEDIKELPETNSVDTEDRRQSASEHEVISIFIQLGSQVKKAELSEISIAAIRLLFIESFSYSPGSENFPDIYIQDKESGIRYQLEESTVCDVKAGTLVSLNIEIVDDSKKETKEFLGKIMTLFKELQETIVSQSRDISTLAASQHKSIEKFSEMLKANEETIASQMSAALNNISKAQSTVPPAAVSTSPSSTPALSAQEPMKTAKPIVEIAEITSLKKELATIRQIHKVMMKNVENTLSSVREKVATSKQTVQTNIVTSGNDKITQYHDRLSDDSDKLLGRVDDIQDLVEALRKDVASRGVRPLPRDLESVEKDLEEAKGELKAMTDYIKKEKPIWKKILEKELDSLVEEQQYFKLQEDLIGDLEEDLEQASETLSLVKQFTEAQSKASRPRAPINYAGGPLSPVDAISSKDAVLKEVKALNPNHESRVEAIERAEKLRKKVNASRVDEFEKELEEFVGESKLKKSGGIEEIERMRKQRDEQVWKEWSEGNAQAMMK